MKFIAAFVALLALAAASPLKPASNELANLELIVAAINSPSTDPATAALLMQQLQEIMLAPISVGAPIVTLPEQPIISPMPVVPGVVLPEPGVLPIMPIILPTPGVLPILPEQPIISPMPVVQPSPIAPIGPIVLPMPVVEPNPVAEPVVPSPVVVGEIPSGSSALVQIIVNVNAAAESVIAPVAGAQEPIAPTPVNVVEQADNIESPVEVSPVQVVEPIVPGPVNIVDHPVSVEAPVVVAPIAVGTPILPAPVMTLPEELN